MLRAVPRIGRILTPLSDDGAVGTTVAFLSDLIVAAVGAIDRMAFVIALLRAEHIAIQVVDYRSVIEIDIARIAVCGGAHRSAFGLTVPIGAMYVMTGAHTGCPPTLYLQSLEPSGAAATT